MKTFYTDYPITQLGDEAYKLAPIRECTIIAFDEDKYCRILVEGVTEDVKAGYIYTSSGRSGKVPVATFKKILDAINER